MQLNYKAYGDGEPLIILHGLFGSLDNWHSIAKKLGQSHRVYIVDLRNHGKSPHASSMTYPAMASDLVKFMNAQGLNAANLAGHSMGGKAAMELALEAPERVKRLISIDMTPFQVNGGHETIIKALKSVDPGEMGKRKEADEALKPYIADFGIRQFLLKNLERRPGGGYQWKMNLPVLEGDYAEILKGVDKDNRSYEGPTLFIKGSRSNYLKADELPAYRQVFPSADLKTVENAGHWVHAEAPEALINLLQWHLDN